jgi:hypothetical protein
MTPACAQTCRPARFFGANKRRDGYAKNRIAELQAEKGVRFKADKILLLPG